MNTVYILGAGFSRALHSRMPLLSDLSNQLQDELPKLMPAAMDTLQLGEIGRDVEALLSYLSQDLPWWSPTERHFHRAAFLELGSLVGRTIGNVARDWDPGDAAAWSRRIVSHWHDKRATVVCFNYDDLVEQLIFKYLDTQNGREPRFTPIPLTPAFNRKSGSWGGEGYATLSLLKLHGSLTWYYSGQERFFGEPIYFGRALVGVAGGRRPSQPNAAFAYDEEEFLLRDKQPLIIPPTIHKSGFMQHESLRTLWSLAHRALSAADKIVVMGYSLPKSDEMVAMMLNTAIRDRSVELVWVNPEDFGSPNGRIQLPGSVQVSHCPSIEEYVDKTTPTHA